MLEALLIILSVVLVAYILIFVSDYMLNDSDQERLNREYAEKAKQHNELMVRKESVPSSFKKESRNGPFSG